MLLNPSHNSLAHLPCQFSIIAPLPYSLPALGSKDQGLEGQITAPFFSHSTP
jgi:hypothetical protein